jgi:hypothetical protein
MGRSDHLPVDSPVHRGLNHLTWERAVLVDDEDRLPEIPATPAAEAGVHLPRFFSEG